MFVSHFQNKIREAADLKGQGNKEFKEKRYHQARDVYQRAVGLVEPYALHGANEAELIRAAELRANLNFNIGLCSFNMMQWREAEIKFTAAIDINPAYAKALCKRAVTRYELAEYKTALVDIKAALQIDPNNQEFYEIMNKIVAKSEDNQREEFRTNESNNDKSTKSSRNQPKPQEPKEEPKPAPIKVVIDQKEAQSKPKSKVGSNWWICGGIAAIVVIGLLITHKHNHK